MEYGGELFDLNANLPFAASGKTQIPADWELFRSGRDALRAFARLAGKRRVLIPALCCVSMILPFRQNDCEVSFYRLREDLSADEEDAERKLTEGSVLLYMRYFGIRPFSDAFLEKQRRRGILMLEDRTHDIWVPRDNGGFQPDAEAASLRKWAALPEGGMLKTAFDSCPADADSRYGDERFAAMVEKNRYLQTGDVELGQKARENARFADRLLDESTDAVRMAPKYREILYGLDFEKILEVRRRNLRRLQMRLEPLIDAGIARLMTGTPEKSGLYLPLLIENRDEVQRELIRRRLYCPAAIWPEPPEAAGICPVSHYVTEHMLSVLCDQRYTETDMDFLANNLIEILKGKVSAHEY